MIVFVWSLGALKHAETSCSAQYLLFHIQEILSIIRIHLKHIASPVLCYVC